MAELPEFATTVVSRGAGFQTDETSFLENDRRVLRDGGPRAGGYEYRGASPGAGVYG